MTDRELFQDMVQRAGIEIKVGPHPYPKEDGCETVLSVVGGYMGFYTCFTFDVNGKLKSIEAYE
jgi:hypothetical protein